LHNTTIIAFSLSIHAAIRPAHTNGISFRLIGSLSGLNTVATGHFPAKKVQAPCGACFYLIVDFWLSTHPMPA
jgi:hypothetical protein